MVDIGVDFIPRFAHVFWTISYEDYLFPLNFFGAFVKDNSTNMGVYF